MARLGLNIDHIATLREARYKHWKEGLAPEPSLLEAAGIAEKAGVQSITVHLREDRRHIQEADVRDLKQALTLPLNLEMAPTPEMVRQALRFQPQEVCLVPENREEVTTEGGLELVAAMEHLKGIIARLSQAGIRVSTFIDPELEQVDAAAKLGAHCIELHTGAYANAVTPKACLKELARHGRAAAHAHDLGLQVNAGHGLHYCNVREFTEDVPHLHTLNIGHAIVARAIFVGLSQALAEMLALLRHRDLTQLGD